MWIEGLWEQEDARVLEDSEGHPGTFADCSV